MNIEDINKQKEIIDFVKDIKDLTKQQKNHQNNGNEIFNNVVKKYKLEV